MSYSENDPLFVVLVTNVISDGKHALMEKNEMTTSSAQQTKPDATVKNIRLADEMDRLQSRTSDSRLMREADCPEKQRVVTARRVKLNGAW